MDEEDQKQYSISLREHILIYHYEKYYSDYRTEKAGVKSSEQMKLIVLIDTNRRKKQGKLPPDKQKSDISVETVLQSFSCSPL